MSGKDTLLGRGAGDILRGGAGQDLLNGQGGQDSLYGGAGADRLVGKDGRKDFLYGGAGNDCVVSWDSTDVIVSARKGCASQARPAAGAFPTNREQPGTSIVEPSTTATAAGAPSAWRLGRLLLAIPVALAALMSIGAFVRRQKRRHHQPVGA
jgi:hypothetical protein